MHCEDVYCPACPNPATAFQIEDVGIKVGKVGDVETTGDGMRITVSRPLWETVMLAHLRLMDDDEHRRLYDLCVTELMTEGKTAEEAARDQMQRLVDSVTSSMRDAMRRHQ